MPNLTISGEADAPLPLRPTDLVVPHGTISLKIHSADQNQLVKYPMFARAKGKLAASTLVALCLVCLLNITMAIKSCSICLIPCILAGVMVFGPIGKQKTEICCEYESPTEMLSTDYHSVANFWKSSREMFRTEMTCPALNECLLMDCTFCIDLLVNPSCNPSLASVLWSLVTLTMLTGLCCVLTLCRSCHQNFRMIVAIERIGCQCWRWMKRKTAYTRARARETIRNKRETLRIGAREWRRTGLTRLARIVATVLLCVIPCVTASQSGNIEGKPELTPMSVKLMHAPHGRPDSLMLW